MNVLSIVTGETFNIVQMRRKLFNLYSQYGPFAVQLNEMTVNAHTASWEKIVGIKQTL